MNVRLGGLLCGMLFAVPVALAQQSDIRVENAWSRAAMQGGTGVVYLTITDAGGPDRLLSITAPVANKAELHESVTGQGVAKMRGIAALPITPRRPVQLAPGGYHIMLMGLKQALKEGESFPVTLNFEHSGAITTTVAVRGMHGDAQKDHDPMGGMIMPGKTP
jgi:periplasmic copper chaperone A